MDGRQWQNEKIDHSIRQNILPGMPSYVIDYYAWLVSQNTQMKTCQCYLRIIRRYLEWINPDTNIIDISKTEMEVIKYQAHSSKTVSGEPVRISTRKTTYYALQSFYSYLREARLVNNPVTGHPPSGFEKIERIRITAKQLEDILAAASKGVGNDHQKAYNEPWRNRDRAILALLICTGMREMAICDLDIDNIDFVKGTIDFVDKGAKEHTFFIEAAIPTIEEWLFDRQDLIYGYAVDPQSENALFITNRRSRITANTVSNITKRYSQAAIGISLPPHKFRGAFINLLYEKTRDIELVRDVVGHACTGTTTRYLPPNMQNKRRAANILQNLVKI